MNRSHGAAAVTGFPKIVRFGLVGLAATGTDFVIFNSGIVVLDEPGRGAVIALNTFAFAMATLVSYQLNARFTFGAARDRQALVRYALVAIGGAIVYNAALLFALRSIAVSDTLLLNAAKAAAVVLSATWNFIGFGTFALVDRTPIEEAQRAS